ncbi:MAG: chaperone modulatory protein CbpM [Bacteroidia bacterium]|jgi:chaperone modulatory protein CbpM
MSLENFIPIKQLCTHYEVELSFFINLDEYGLIEIMTIEQAQYVRRDNAGDIEKIIRMNQELEINLEGIDTIFNLLKKIDGLQAELISVRNKLKRYED